MTISKSLLDLIGNTPLVKLSNIDTGLCDLYVKMESENPGGSIKDRIGLSIIEEAEKEGRLKKGGTIIEATAGNTGIGLALVASLKGYKMVLVIPDKMSREKILHLEGLGVEVILTRSDVPEGHPEYYQDVARKLANDNPDYFFADQFSNPANPLAHKQTTAPEIWKQMEGDIDAVVAGVGSGGTITGLGQYFKSKDPSIQVIAADPLGSVVADAVIKGEYKYEGGAWLVEGVGEDFIPNNLDLSLIDDAETVSDKEAFYMLKILLQEEGILGGSSTGTLVAGAVKWCKKQETKKRVVTFICDTGNKYLSKAFNKSWLHDNNLLESKETSFIKNMINRRADKGEMITVTTTDSLLVAYNRMRASDVSQIPVLNNNQLVGLVDEEDLLLSVSRNKETFSETVASIMVKDLDKLDIGATEKDLVDILSQGKVAIIYHDSQFLGFITKVDLINYYRNKL
tara:strand:+ start:57315 stop:58682 length:1368 start_codon:yes stop_codon:yes gene_type:complete